ncbi:MAG: alpha/beta fold hydrolase [Candidatus Rokuibacteriota bacterium]
MIPAWVDRERYPFESRALNVGAGTMRYVDEGSGPPIVMVHGTPTWSFLYRDLVRGLRDRYRCVVPDQLGFGLSDKPTGASYRPDDQAQRLTRLIDTLALKDVTLMVHDFGGPIGLAYAIEHPANVRRLVLFNTWMWSLAGDRQMQWIRRALGGRLGRVLYEHSAFPVNVLFRRAFGDRRRYTPEAHAQYLGPLRDPAARHATWIYARELLGSSSWYGTLWQRRSRIARIPALLVWGMKDPAFARCLPRWRGLFTDAEVVELPDVGHAPMEERAPEITPVIARFLETGTAP